MPLIVNFKKRFNKFIVKNLNCSNQLVIIVSKIACGLRQEGYPVVNNYAPILSINTPGKGAL